MPVAWENPFPGQHVATTHFEGEMYSNLPEVVRRIEDANLVTSLVDELPPLDWFGQRAYGDDGPTHKPVIDVDFPVKVLESSTPGHHHLFIDKELTWHQYLRVLDVLAEVGIVERGYVEASREREFTAVRLPWIKKVTQ